MKLFAWKVVIGHEKDVVVALDRTLDAAIDALRLRRPEALTDTRFKSLEFFASFDPPPEPTE